MSHRSTPRHVTRFRHSYHQRPHLRNGCRSCRYHPQVDALEERWLLDATLLPGDLMPAQAAGEQNPLLNPPQWPQLARGGDQYLAVWTDLRTAYNRLAGGTLTPPGLGTKKDIYAARLDAAGNLIDTTPLIISQAPHNQSDPLVAWNGENWLVVWKTERLENWNRTDVLAVRVAPDGTILDTPPILVNYGEETVDDFRPFSVTTDGSNWVVTWRDMIMPQRTYTLDAARIAPDGTLLDPDGRRLVAQRTDYVDMAQAGEEYVMVWVELRGGGWTTLGQRLALDLEPIGKPIELLRHGSGTAPRIASNGESYFVIWTSMTSAGTLRGSRLSAEGELLDPAGISIAVRAIGGVVDWDGSNWVAAWSRFGTPHDDLYAARIAPDGSLLDPNGLPISTALGDQRKPAIAGGFGGETQFIWVNFSNGNGETDLVGAQFGPDGAVGAETPIGLGAPRQLLPRMTAGGEGFLAVFASDVSGLSRILAHRLDSLGNPLDEEPLEVAAAYRGLTNPAVAWNGSVFLVVWDSVADQRVFGRRVAPDGTLLDKALLDLMPGQMVDVAALGDTFLVVDAAPVSVQIQATHAIRVGGDGSILGPRLRVGVNYDVSPRVAALGERWLVVWRQRVTHDNPRSSIAAAFIAQDGTSTGSFTLGPGAFADTPHLAVSGNEALVVWSDNQTSVKDIYGRRIQADGTLLPMLQITSHPNTEILPSVAWDGTQYLVTWLDHRDDAPPSHAIGNVYAARVTLDGIVRDPDGFAIANSPLPEETPFVAASNGITLFVYALFVDQAPYAAYRIAMQVFSTGPGSGPSPGGLGSQRDPALRSVLLGPSDPPAMPWLVASHTKSLVETHPTPSRTNDSVRDRVLETIFTKNEASVVPPTSLGALSESFLGWSKQRLESVVPMLFS